MLDALMTSEERAIRDEAREFAASIRPALLTGIIAKSYPIDDG